MDGWQRFKEATERKKCPRPIPNQNPEKWLPLKEILYKANVDAALDRGCGRGCGLIIRDSKGDQMVAACVRTEANWDAETTETYVVFQGLKIAREAGIQDLVMESEALRVVQALQGSKRRSCASIFINKALSLVPCFNIVSFCHVNSSANSVAHELAKHALCLEGETVWLEKGPSCIASLVEKEKPFVVT